MSILLKNMTMPKQGDKFEVCVDADGRLFLYKEGSVDDIWYMEELPQHGRLIDADKLVKEHEQVLWICKDDVSVIRLSKVKDAPTVIEAEE